MVDSPYARDLDGRDPLRLLEETPAHVRERLTELGADGLSRPYAPGKWTARQVLVHLAQLEIVTANRIRMALTTAGYTTQNFEQDEWVALDAGSSVDDVYAVYAAVRRMTLTMAAGLTEPALARRLTHHMFGEVTVQWMLEQLAGHEQRHLAQLRAIEPA